jgi:heavy metal sensor kinase
VFSSVRARLTLWYVSVLGVLLIALSIGAYFLLAHSLYEQMDARLASSLQATTSALKHVLSDRAGNADAILRALDELPFLNQTVAVLDAKQRVVAQKIGPGGPPLQLPPSPLNVSENIGFYEISESESDDSDNESVADDGCRGALQRVTTTQPVGFYTVVVTESLESLIDKLELLQNFLYLLVPLILVLAGFGGWFLARRSLAPVVAMSDRAQQISVENLDHRLPVANPRDELGRLATTFNDLLARLNQSFAQQRQFMTDASHELRTPLSAIRTTSAVTLQRKDRESSEYREALAVIEQEARRLTRIVEDMFLLARADAGHPTLQITKFYLDELLAESARAAGVLASQKGLHLQVSPLPEAPLTGDEALLRQMMWNLLDNAIKHTPPGGKVGVVLESRDSEYVITVTDTGSGISGDAKPHIFERFYRADPARTQAQTGSDGGAGLGLPIARWIAEAHHGRIELRHSDATGSTFVVTLPRT